MKIKVFYPNEKGNIEITKEKLESLLKEAYSEGYRDGKNSNGYYYCNTTPYISTCTDNTISCAGDVAYLNSTTTAEKCDKASTIDSYANTNAAITAGIPEAKVADICLEYIGE